MSITSFKSSFLINPLTTTIKPQKFVAVNSSLVSNVVSCRNNSPDDHRKDSSTRFLNLYVYVYVIVGINE